MRKNLNIFKIILILFFTVTIVLPVVLMAANIGDIDLLEFTTSSQFKVALKNSIRVSATATIISVTLAFLLSFSLVRSKIRLKGWFEVLLTLPMLIPSISHGMGLVILFGTNGVLTNIFHLNKNIYGFWGIVIGSVMYSFPVSFLMINDILKYEDYTPYEAADVLGFSKWDKLRAITIPYMRKPMISVVFANLTLVLTDYGVPLIVGGKVTTLPVLMYQEVIGMLNFNKGIVIGVVLLVPAVIVFIIDLINKDKANMSFVIKEFDRREGKLRDKISYIFIISVITLMALPIIAFIVLTFTSDYPGNMSFTLKYIQNTLKMSGREYLINSIIISISVSLIGTLFAFIASYLTVRTRGKWSKYLHLLSLASLSIPGIVLGLSYALFFNKSVIYGTIAMLILVNLVHFFTSPYIMMYNALGKINENLESVGMTLGINRVRIIKDVMIPQTLNTILEMISYFFVNSMITISAVSFLANVRNKPLSLLINQFEGNMMIEASAFVSLLILVINMIVKVIVYLTKKKRVMKG